MKYYSMTYKSEMNMNDSDEKIREWGTATVMSHSSRKERDEYVAGSVKRVVISAKRAHKIADEIEEYNDEDDGMYYMYYPFQTKEERDEWEKSWKYAE